MELISRAEVLDILKNICNHALKVYDKKYHLPITTITATATENIKELPSQWVETYEPPFGKVYQNDFVICLSTETYNEVSRRLSRPKGKWLRKEYNFDEWVDECSACGEAYTMIDGTATENGYNYCPNCGAYMGREK